jgi:hypothetical protein
MIRTVALLLVAAVAAFSQDHHHDMVNSNGDQVMGFSHEKTTHHFELNYEGGVIDIRSDDAKDTLSRNEIRTHLHHIVKMFSNGNFDAPMLVHSTAVPGTADMANLKSELHWTVKNTSRGAKIIVVADSKPALDAVHEFLRFQIEDHQTGDCPMVH